MLKWLVTFRDNHLLECYLGSCGAEGERAWKSLKGFQFAKLYFEVKEYELAKRYISTYLSVQKRDRRAHRFLGQIYEAEDNIEEAFGCYRRSVELNPMQKDLVLKIAELLCNNAVTDERAKYWVEKSAKLFPGSPAVYKLKEQLLDCKAPSLAELHKYDVDNTLPSHLGKSQSNSELQVARQNLQQHETKMSQLRETLRKMTDENNELRSSLNSLRENNELLKTQLLRISKVYDPLTILMDWISDQHLSKIEIQEEREGSEKPQCAKENYTLENCMKLLPMVTGQLQWMPFVDPKLHMSVIQFIYWSLRQIDTGSQDASMTATMERLAEVILKGAVQKGSMQKWTKKSTRSKPKAAHFFKSSSMPLRFLSTLVVLRTAKRMNYLTQAFRSLCVDLKTDEGKILFLQYRCVPIILSHLTISKKCLLFIALNALVEMAMNNDKK
uniref:Coiled-coil domain-containing protein n=1 Tax=Anas platyrhynchos TaxID=8839 RepID=A0A8B9R7P6_ANAPL